MYTQTHMFNTLIHIHSNTHIYYIDALQRCRQLIVFGLEGIFMA